MTVDLDELERLNETARDSHPIHEKTPFGTPEDVAFLNAVYKSLALLIAELRAYREKDKREAALQSLADQAQKLDMGY